MSAITRQASVLISVPKIYRPIRTVWCGLFNVSESDLLWCDGNRPSSLGGYIGTFRRTYQHTGNMISPTGEPFQLHMRNVRPDPGWK